jgi:GT2 family glycosyltransferase
LFWEEADFCMRAKKAGFKLGICYGAKLLHKVSASFVGGTPHKTYFWWRGRFLFIERNCSHEEKERIYKTLLTPKLRHLRKLRLLKAVQSLLTRDREKKSKVLQYRAALEGYDDFQKKIFGRGPEWLTKVKSLDK